MTQICVDNDTYLRHNVFDIDMCHIGWNREMGFREGLRVGIQLAQELMEYRIHNKIG